MNAFCKSAILLPALLFLAVLFDGPAYAQGGSEGVWSFSGSQPSSTACWSRAATLQQLRSPDPPDQEEVSEGHTATAPFEVGMEERSTSWRGDAPAAEAQTGETRVFERRRLLRTHASGLVADNVHMSLGPELLFREKQVEKEGISDSSEPEATLGFGMRFQVEF